MFCSSIASDGSRSDGHCSTQIDVVLVLDSEALHAALCRMLLPQAYRGMQFHLLIPSNN